MKLSSQLETTHLQKDLNRDSCKTLIFGGNLILAILAVKVNSAKILISQYYIWSLIEVLIKRRTQ